MKGDLNCHAWQELLLLLLLLLILLLSLLSLLLLFYSKIYDHSLHTQIIIKKITFLFNHTRKKKCRVNQQKKEKLPSYHTIELTKRIKSRETDLPILILS